MVLAWGVGEAVAVAEAAAEEGGRLLYCSEKALGIGAEETGLRGGRLCVGSAACVDGGGCFSVIIQKRPHHGGGGR